MFHPSSHSWMKKRCCSLKSCHGPWLGVLSCLLDHQPEHTCKPWEVCPCGLCEMVETGKGDHLHLQPAHFKKLFLCAFCSHLNNTIWCKNSAAILLLLHQPCFTSCVATQLPWRHRLWGSNQHVQIQSYDCNHGRPKLWPQDAATLIHQWTPLWCWPSQSLLPLLLQ